MPSKRTLPRVGRSRPTTKRATEDFPHPDSPTRLKVSPRRIVNFTPSTALSVCTGRRSRTRASQGLETSYVFTRSRTSIRGPEESVI